MKKPSPSMPSWRPLQQDPIIRWILPKADTYLTHAANFFAQFGGPAFAAGTAFQAADYAGAALWVPPGHEDEQAEEVVGEMLTQLVPPATAQ
jgi:hypothetical protein